jgi:hypothetical protein
MTNYTENLNELFDEWEKTSIKQGLRDFCCDGLMFKGDKFKNKDGWWGRNPGDENKLWQKAKKRILFLLKDPNKSPGEDMRFWTGTGKKDPSLITSRFFKNIALWLTGLNSVQADGTYLPMKKAVLSYSKAFYDLPFAIVNIKKESGGGSVSNLALYSYVETYSEYLKKEIEILSPNIIVCGGGSSFVLNVATNYIYPGISFSKVNDWIYFNKGKNVVLIDSYHPSSRSISDKDIYESMMKAYGHHLSRSMKEKPKSRSV